MQYEVRRMVFAGRGEEKDLKDEVRRKVFAGFAGAENLPIRVFRRKHSLDCHEVSRAS